MNRGSFGMFLISLAESGMYCCAVNNAFEKNELIKGLSKGIFDL
ncbi:hypothetical protein [Virgibacillus sp. AGTR]|nr:hypothetical protein [Virgibacillus sp. AGTR]MDY7045943.1 hypothetical protein [Virgibacillus sp. M23]